MQMPLGTLQSRRQKDNYSNEPTGMSESQLWRSIAKTVEFVTHTIMDIRLATANFNRLRWVHLMNDGPWI